MPPDESPANVDPTLGKVLVSMADGVGWLELDNPTRRNAISSGMWRDLRAALESFADQSNLRCVVLGGKGTESFCAGADLADKEFAAGGDPTFECLDYIKKFPKPVIAMVSGYCVGAGVALAVACDLRVGSSNAQFSIPTARIGLAPVRSFVGGLVRLIGPSGTKRLLFTAERVSAVEALRLGLLDDVVPEPELHARVLTLTSSIVANAPLSIEAAKFAVDAEVSASEQRDLEECAVRERACLQSRDYLEGRRAFLEKRKPVFRGQ